MEHLSNPRFPHSCVISRRVNDDDPMTDDEDMTVVYQGECRSFDVHTTSDTGDVLTSTRKVSLPVRQDEWGEERPIPQEGDGIVVDKGSYVEYGVVIDRMPGNLGTHILWKYGRE